MHLRQPEVQKAYREAAKRTGLEIASLAIGEMNSVPLKSDPRGRQWLAESIDVCTGPGAAGGVGRLLLQGRSGHEADRRDRPPVVQVLKDVAPKAEKRESPIGLENYLSAEDNMRIIERVGSPAVKVYYDVGNSTDKGRDVVKEIRTLGKLICEFHAKDAGYMLGQGRIDFKAGPQGHGRHPVQRLDPDRGRRAARPDTRLTKADRKFLKGLFPAQRREISVRRVAKRMKGYVLRRNGASLSFRTHHVPLCDFGRHKGLGLQMKYTVNIPSFGQ